VSSDAIDAETASQLYGKPGPGMAPPPVAPEDLQD